MQEKKSAEKMSSFWAKMAETWKMALSTINQTVYAFIVAVIIYM
jgi:hypothetical protein